MSHAEVSVPVRAIAAGKLRRYHTVSWWRQLLDIPTTAANLRDLAFIAAGFFQSLWLLLTWRPDAVFTKGGFVCLPVGIAARLLGIPLVIHDSDAHPGLTNRLLSRWASYIATGAPLENYPYPVAKSRYVGIPVDESFRPYTLEQQRDAKSAIGLIDTTKPLVVVTGGGLGAQRVNTAMVRIGDQLTEDGVCVYHITGQGQYDVVAAQAPHSVDYQVVPFVAQRMYDVLGAADVVVTRAGATTLLELAALAKPIIIIPNPLLTGGHQLKNAAVYAEAQAAIVLDERELGDNPGVLQQAIMRFVGDPELAQAYGQRLQQFAKPEAAHDTAALIIKAVKRQKRGR